jgi:hypothetical protein
VSSDLKRFLEFLEGQRVAHASRFPGMRAEKVLTFMATTSRPGSMAQVSIHPLLGVAAGEAPGQLRVELGGRLPLRPRQGECLAVHLARYELYQGYQVKSRPLAEGRESDLWEDHREGFTVLGAQLFTVHLSPFALRFFEEVPFEAVRDLAREVRHVLCAVGETANLSPRFVYHQEVEDGRVVLFHGDGLPLKTYQNLRRNRLETRLVLDLSTFRGWALRGTVEEVAPAGHPAGCQKVLDGFAAGGWSQPSRFFRFVADSLEEIGPVE